MRSMLLLLSGVLFSSLFGAEKPRKDIPVGFLYQDRHPFGLQEIGASASAALEDTLTVKVTLASSKKTVEDSRWTFHSVDSVGNEIRAQRDLSGTLRTEGQYVFVSYTIENLQKVPAQVPSFAMFDDKGRKFLPLDYWVARKYLPAEYDTQDPSVNAGLKRKYCSIYELPKEAKPVAIELFPLCGTVYHKMNMNHALSGKKVNIASNENDAFASVNSVEGASKTSSSRSEKPFMLTMKCTRTENKEEKISRALTLRTLGYTVELKGLNVPQKEVCVKAYFIGESGLKKMMIAEIVEKEVTVCSTKATSFKVVCQPVGENERHDMGLELKGVILQAWADGKLIQSYTSQYAWKKYAEMPDILTKIETFKRPQHRLRP